MRSPVVLLAATAAFFPTYAFQLPFNIQLPFFSSGSQTPLVAPPEPANTAVPNRVAIIGAGAAGSSAAYWISKAKERFGVDVEVDIYEKNAYIGGRSTVVTPYDDLTPIELGASVFVKANKNMWRAVDEFGLERTGFDDEKEVMGIWDGEQFPLTMGGTSFYSDWLDKLKIVWRYGYHAPSKTQSLVTGMIDGFLRLYDRCTPRWSNTSEVVAEMEWTDVVAQSMSEYMDLEGIDRRWTRELVEAATRVNYGQNVDKIHALEGLVSLAASGVSSVKGGNFQVFERFVAASNASVYLNTTVKSVSQLPSGSWLLSSTASKTPRTYRAVILAAPYHQTGITFTSPSDAPLAHVPPQPYVRLHVTLLATTAAGVNASYFHLASHKRSDLPTTVLTTYEGVRQRGGTPPEFNSLTFHSVYSLQSPNDSTTGAIRGEHGRWGAEDPPRIVKIFSKARIDDEWLAEMFGGMDNLPWVYRKEWDAYPVLPPTTSFPPVKIGNGLYYVNAFEPVISTMETETIASRNVVELLMREQFDAGLCPPHKSSADEPTAETTKSDGFVYGWDC